MPYVTRDNQNRIITFSNAPQFEGQEFVEGPVELYDPNPVFPTEAVLQSPSGTPFKVTVEDDGSLATQEVNNA